MNTVDIKDKKANKSAVIKKMAELYNTKHGGKEKIKEKIGNEIRGKHHRNKPSEASRIRNADELSRQPRVPFNINYDKYN